MPRKHYLRDQAVALILTVLTCLVLVVLVWLEIKLLNRTLDDKIVLTIRPADVLVGMTIYLKTAIDFAIFIAGLMDKNPGLKGRIGIEVGTAVGNGVGSLLILLIWSFFKEVNWLLAIMILVAALVLLRLAEDTIVEVNPRHPLLRQLMDYLGRFLGVINKITAPLLSRIVPSSSMSARHQKSLFALLGVAFTVPFILGLDDFAGYVPLFSIVNVFGFIVGVLIGHMLLNIALYVSPRHTIAAIKNPLIALVGGLAFIALSAWGIVEAVRLLIG